MKEWLRQHPDQVPQALSADDNNSHQLRDGLKRKAWSVSETEDEVRIMRPDVGEDASAAFVLGEPDENADSQEQQLEFALESHLRDFIARNLATLPVANKRLSLFEDQLKRKGVEYQTDVG